MPKRRAIYAITPPDPQASNAPRRVSESASAASYGLRQQRPPADLTPRKTANAGNGLQAVLPLEEEQADPTPPIHQYTVTIGWIDAAKRTRTWKLLDPSGKPMAEITTKRDATRIADLFNELLPLLVRLQPDPQGGPPDPAP